MEQANGIKAEVGQIMNSSLEIRDVYDRFTIELQNLLPFACVSISTIDADRLVPPVVCNSHSMATYHASPHSSRT